MDTGYWWNGYGPHRKRHALRCILYAPYTPSKETFTACKEPYSAEVSHELICVRQAWHLICARCDMKADVYPTKRDLQCRGMRRFDLCDTSPWYHEGYSVLQCVTVCCSVLQCVEQCVLVHVRRLLGITCVAVCCSALQCVVACDAVCCSVLQCVAVCCSVL